VVRARLERRDDLVVVDGLAVEVALHERLGHLADLVHELLAVLQRERGQVVGDRHRRAALAACVVVPVGLHVDEVDDPGDVLLAAHGDLRGHDVRPERRLERVERPEGVGPLAVEHRDEDQPGEVQLRRALPQAQRRGLDPHDRVHDEDGGLAHPQGAERVGDEARLARGVEEVDLPLAPGER
jgi:hypothetical protein